MSGPTNGQSHGGSGDGRRSPDAVPVDPGGPARGADDGAPLKHRVAQKHGVAQKHCVTVNGQRREVPAGGSAHDLVVALGLAGRPLAVEVDGVVVPRARLADCMLEPESVIEIVTLVGGG
jgi:sulfur carrier protein